MRSKAGDCALDRLEIAASKSGSRLRLRVRPAAKTTVIEGEHGGALKLAVRAAPERGRANEEVERVIAEKLGLSRSAVEVVAGHGSRNKLVEIRGLAPQDVRFRLTRAAEMGDSG